MLAAGSVPTETIASRGVTPRAWSAALRPRERAWMPSAIGRPRSSLAVTGGVSLSSGDPRFDEVGDPPALLRGAALNVMINLASLSDAAQVKVLSEELDRALEGTAEQRQRVTDFVESRVAR